VVISISNSSSYSDSSGPGESPLGGPGGKSWWWWR